MRIIDKNNDIYDYLQDSKDTLVFDRRGSYELTKDRICSTLDMVRYDRSKYRFLVLQCGATYWLILLTITSRDSYRATSYDLELLAKWKNYNKKRAIIKLDVVEMISSYTLRSGDFKHRDYDVNKIKKAIETIKKDIDLNNCYAHTIAEAEYTTKDWCTKKEKHVYAPPLIKSTGIPNIIEPIDIFLAIEEHFSLIKTEAEKTEAIGTTNNDKIVSHGFDLKTSFRGKNK